MPKNPTIAVNEGHTATVIPTTAVLMGAPIGFNGELCGFDAPIYGIAKFDGVANQPLTIITSNEAIVRLSVTVNAIGQRLTADGASRVALSFTNGNVSLRALQTGVAGDYIRALICREGVMH